MGTMLGWVSEATGDVHWRAFNQYDQQLIVVNANREPAEHIFGVDVIYYNMIHQSIVLIQYKKLDAAKGGFYYPNNDHNLDKQLSRLRKVDDYVATHRKSGEDFRLLSSPSWLKICYPESVIPTGADMIHGMYLARGHFEQLRDDTRLKGARDGIRFGYQSVPYYLDNTMFTRLVETGLIGTAGTSTELVHRLIVETFTGGKALVMGVLAGDDMLQSERNRRRRTGHTRAQPFARAPTR